MFNLYIFLNALSTIWLLIFYFIVLLLWFAWFIINSVWTDTASFFSTHPSCLIVFLESHTCIDIFDSTCYFNVLSFIRLLLLWMTLHAFVKVALEWGALCLLGLLILFNKILKISGSGSIKRGTHVCASYQLWLVLLLLLTHWVIIRLYEACWSLIVLLSM